MIFEIVNTANKEVIFKLSNHYYNTSIYDVYDMLESAFPQDNPKKASRDFHICSAGGFDNAIVFIGQ